MAKDIILSTTSSKALATLTTHLQIGSEATVGRFCLGYSLGQAIPLKLVALSQKNGKSYKYHEVLGNYELVFKTLISDLYQLQLTAPEIHWYIKLHLEEGIRLLEQQRLENPNKSGYELVNYLLEEQ